MVVYKEPKITSALKKKHLILFNKLVREETIKGVSKMKKDEVDKVFKKYFEWDRKSGKYYLDRSFHPLAGGDMEIDLRDAGLQKYPKEEIKPKSQTQPKKAEAKPKPKPKPKAEAKPKKNMNNDKKVFKEAQAFVKPIAEQFDKDMDKMIISNADYDKITRKLRDFKKKYIDFNPFKVEKPTLRKLEQLYNLIVRIANRSIKLKDPLFQGSPRKIAKKYYDILKE